MKLNKWLCKHFDDERNGYVTLFDILIPILRGLLTGGVTVLILWALGLLSYQITTFPTNIQEHLYVLKTGIIGVGQLIIFCLGAIIILFIIAEILSVKVATCELKEDSKDRQIQ